MSLALADYQAAVALAEERHFGRAARRLDVTQPAVTARLRRMEATVGARLFDRGRSGVVPTEAGIAFLEGARRVLDAASETADAVRGAAAGLGQTLRIGMTQIAAYQVVARVLAAFRNAQPLARVYLTENVTARLEAALERREIDAAFLHPPLHATGLSEKLLMSVPFRRYHRRGQEKAPLIAYPRAEAPVLMTSLMRREGPNASPPRVEADTILGAILLAQAGYGVFAAPEDFPHVELSERVVADAEAEILETSIAWRSLDRRPLVRALIEAAQTGVATPSTERTPTAGKRNAAPGSLGWRHRSPR
jgi:DNA-binding transcriptional LysR family regulator